MFAVCAKKDGYELSVRVDFKETAQRMLNDIKRINKDTAKLYEVREVGFADEFNGDDSQYEDN